MRQLEFASRSLCWLTAAILLLSLLVTALPAQGQNQAVQKEPEPSQARITVLWALGIAAGVFFLLFVFQLLFQKDAPQVVSHWGGFGGGLGGWSISPSAAFLLAALVLSVLLVVLTPVKLKEDTDKKNSSSTPAPTPTPAPAPATPAPSPSPTPTAN
jgi:uncharacterized BrkB/YihY/UPF0761 family membrane protein